MNKHERAEIEVILQEIDALYQRSGYTVCKNLAVRLRRLLGRDQ